MWFEKGVSHRDTSKPAAWSKKPLRLQVAIILAANKHKTDYWELIKPKFQDRYLAEADRLIEGQGQEKRRQGQGRGREVAA